MVNISRKRLLKLGAIAFGTMLFDNRIVYGSNNKASYKNINNISFFDIYTVGEILALDVSLSNNKLIFGGNKIVFSDDYTYSYNGKIYNLLTPYKIIDGLIFLDQSIIKVVKPHLRLFIFLDKTYIYNREGTYIKTYESKPTVPPVINYTNTNIPILMYHAIDEQPTKDINEYYVTPSNFEAQIKLLTSKGYNSVTMEEVYRHWQNGEKLPEKPYVISFDDGYLADWKNALPIMLKYEQRGCHYVVTKMIQEHDNFMDVSHLKELQNFGCLIGNHTHEHKGLNQVGYPDLKKEIIDAHNLIEKWTGIPCEHMCYPYGQYNNNALKVIRDLGYKTALSTIYANANKKQGMYTLRRIRVNYSDSIDSFANKLGIII